MRALGAVIASLCLCAVPAASKEFPPGELTVCGASQCRVVINAQSRAFSDLLWGDPPVTRAPTPTVGSAIYQLRFENGPLGAIINSTAIRVHGLRCGRLQRGKWYRLPPTLRGVSAGMKPKQLRASIPRSC